MSIMFKYVDIRSGVFIPEKELNTLTECLSTSSYTSYKLTKMVRFSTKPIYDFLLVNHANLPSILHRFRDMADYWSNFR